jgi:hypothetical protein
MEGNKLLLEAEIRLLESLPYVHAYRGSLDNLEQRSYVEYSTVLKILNEKKKELKNLKK